VVSIVYTADSEIPGHHALSMDKQASTDVFACLRFIISQHTEDGSHVGGLVRNNVRTH
jgi:hypothetical protein